MYCTVPECQEGVQAGGCVGEGGLFPHSQALGGRARLGRSHSRPMPDGTQESVRQVPQVSHL